MTTNVYDGNAGLMATDSRWSLTFLNYLCYLDDVGFEKIERLDDYLFMFAGLGPRVQEWKDWIRSKPAGMAGQPQHQGMSVTMVRISDKGVMFSLNKGAAQSGAIFAGTGWYPAITCWLSNKCAKRAVETAKTVDVYTGGDTKFFDLAKGDHNLYPTAKEVRYADFARIFKERGLVMKLDGKGVGKPPFPRKDAVAASNDADILKDVSAKIASGELHASAPCEEMVREWTAEEKEKFNSALAEAFGWKK